MKDCVNKTDQLQAAWSAFEQKLRSLQGALLAGRACHGGGSPGWSTMHPTGGSFFVSVPFCVHFEENKKTKKWGKKTKWKKVSSQQDQLEQKYTKEFTNCFGLSWTLQRQATKRGDPEIVVENASALQAGKSQQTYQVPWFI